MEKEKIDYLLDRLSRVEQADTDSLRLMIEVKMRRKGRHIPIGRIVKVCAAVIIPFLVATGLWFYFDAVKSDSPMEKVASATDNVRLTLPDGREIVLDGSDQDGLLHLRDDLVMIRENGNIIAEASPGEQIRPSVPEYGSIEIPKGTFFDITLSDGTRVWLNSESCLRFPLRFTGEERRVYLSGEGYFDVKNSGDKLFVVEAGGKEIIVRGTAFNVAAYEDTEDVIATLVKGAVEIISGEESALLEPGHQAVMTRAGSRITVSRVDSSLYSSWTTGVFDFEEMNLYDICARLARWYDVEFEFEGGTGNERFSGGAWMNEPLGNFLSFIEMATDVTFSEKEGRVVVSPKK